jgi:two-component sensor histidine kinase
MNQRLAEINGLPMEAHLGKRSRDLVPSVANTTEAIVRRVLETGEPALGCEVVGETPARPGEQRVWIDDMVPLRDATGRVTRVSIVVREVTEQRATEAALRDALTAKEVLLHEVNHRVVNSLQLVSSLLTLQAAQSNEPALRDGLAEARTRIGAVAEVHRRLYWSGAHVRIDNLGEFLRDLCHATLTALEPEGRVHLDFRESDGPRATSLDIAVPLALIASELLTNAVKYAFPEGARGCVNVVLGPAPDLRNGLSLVVEDDGGGLPEGFDPMTSAGFGMRIVAALARQLAGRVLSRSGPSGRGAVLEILVPEEQTPPAEGGSR